MSTHRPRKKGKSGLSRMIRTEFKSRAGLTMYRVAADLKLPQSTVVRVLIGEVDPSAETAEKLLDYFGFRIVPPQRKGKA